MAGAEEQIFLAPARLGVGGVNKDSSAAAI